MELQHKIEAVLFWKAEPIKIAKLATLLHVSDKDIEQGLISLKQNLSNRGITLIQTQDEVMLGTAKEHSHIIEQLTKDELIRDLGRAGLETISIILYQGPISRADIDYIRGVNSQFIIRNLLIRGLVERIDNPKDARSFLYKPTVDLLAHLGISKIEDLPEYEQVRQDIESFKNTNSTPSNAELNTSSDPSNPNSKPEHNSGS